jgi:hypothetical protein
VEAAATAFLESLRNDQIDAACFAFGDDAVRRDWTYLPGPRSGLSLGAMTVEQQQLAMQLLASALSTPAFATAAVIMALEDVLDQIEGGHRGRHRNDYYVTIFGTRGAALWGWRCEGHHLSVNVSVVDGEVADTPLFFGANPAAVGTIRPLAPEEDLGRRLARLVGAPAVIAESAPDDILTKDAPAVDGSVQPEGIALASLADEASHVAGELVAVYLGRLPEQRRPAWTDLGELHFGWAGSLEPGEGHYYRLQGPRFLVEYDNTQNGANHIHTVMRDTANDFGDDALRRHRTESHHTQPNPSWG